MLIWSTAVSGHFWGQAGLYRGSKDLEGLLYIASQCSSEELLGGGGLCLGLTRDSSHVLTDMITGVVALDELQTPLS